MNPEDYDEDYEDEEEDSEPEMTPEDWADIAWDDRYRHEKIMELHGLWGSEH